jgi:hypothetical protein
MSDAPPVLLVHGVFVEAIAYQKVAMLVNEAAAPKLVMGGQSRGTDRRGALSLKRRGTRRRGLTNCRDAGGVDGTEWFGRPFGGAPAKVTCLMGAGAHLSSIDRRSP